MFLLRLEEVGCLNLAPFVSVAAGSHPGNGHADSRLFLGVDALCERLLEAVLELAVADDQDVLLVARHEADL